VKNFQIGEKVGFLHERGTGIVKGFRSKDELIVEDETGFERFYPLEEVIKIHSTDFEIDFSNPLLISGEPEINTSEIYEKEELIYGNAKASKFWEIDLHIEELTDSHRGMSNAEILQKQLGEFRAFFRKAIKHRIPKLIVIHGVGEGVLKDEIRLFLSKKEHIEYFDASYQEYGKGATEIRLAQILFDQNA